MNIWMMTFVDFVEAAKTEQTQKTAEEVMCRGVHYQVNLTYTFFALVGCGKTIKKPFRDNEFHKGGYQFSFFIRPCALFYNNVWLTRHLTPLHTAWLNCELPISVKGHRSWSSMNNIEFRASTWRWWGGKTLSPEKNTGFGKGHGLPWLVGWLGLREPDSGRNSHLSQLVMGGRLLDFHWSSPCCKPLRLAIVRLTVV